VGKYLEKSKVKARDRLANEATVRKTLMNHIFSIQTGSGTLIPRTETSASTSILEPVVINLGLTKIIKKRKTEINKGK
jgi:hypothetical protein